MLGLQEEEMCNAMRVSLQGTLPETVPIDQVFKKAPETQGQVCSQVNSKETTGL